MLLANSVAVKKKYNAPVDLSIDNLDLHISSSSLNDKSSISSYGCSDSSVPVQSSQKRNSYKLISKFFSKLSLTRRGGSEENSED